MRRKPIDQMAAATAREAESQFNQLKRSLQAAAASFAHLRSSLHVPVIKPGQERVRGSRSRPSLFLSAGASSLGGFLSGEIVGGGGDLLDDIFGGSDFGGSLTTGSSFQQSAAQFAGKLFDASLRGQRIR